MNCKSAVHDSLVIRPSLSTTLEANLLKLHLWLVVISSDLLRRWTS